MTSQDFAQLNLRVLSTAQDCNSILWSSEDLGASLMAGTIRPISQSINQSQCLSTAKSFFKVKQLVYS